MFRPLLFITLALSLGACSGKTRRDVTATSTNTTGEPAPSCGDPMYWRRVHCWPAGVEPLVMGAAGDSSVPPLDANGCGPADAYDWRSIDGGCGGSSHCDVATPIEGPGTCCFPYEIGCKV